MVRQHSEGGDSMSRKGENTVYEDYRFEITDESTRAHDVSIRLTDAAGNETKEEIVDFYVTTNLWVRFINNKLLVAVCLASIVFLIMIPLFFVERRRRRRQNAG